jgi:DNA topoisomerase-2
MEQSITDILNTDYRSYARYTVEHRAIPAFADGLKPVQRKIIAAALKTCADRFIKVSALSGKVIGDMDYHHGDTSCQGAIIVMNQEFMQGLPYLDKDGQFGWLYDKAAGAPRYIFTKVSGWTKLIMRDDAELTYHVTDTGDKAEPHFYLPLLPMMLINGTDGIAVGYSTSFINRNPLEVALATREAIVNGKTKAYQLTPYAKGHTGLWSYWNGQFEHVAPWHRKNQTVLCIDGLPADTTKAKYNDYLNSLVDQGFINKWSDISNKDKILYEIQMKATMLDGLIDNNGIPGFFRLIYRLPNDNLTCVMPDRSIKRFERPTDIINEFVEFRLSYYSKRKIRIIRDLKARIAYLKSLITFIKLVNDGTIVFRDHTKAQIEQQLKELDIDKAVLNVQVFSLTLDNMNKHITEHNKLVKELEKTSSTDERAMYLADIDDLLVHLRKWFTIEPVINIKNEQLLRIENP